MLWLLTNLRDYNGKFTLSGSWEYLSQLSGGSA